VRSHRKLRVQRLRKGKEIQSREIIGDKNARGGEISQTRRDFNRDENGMHAYYRRIVSSTVPTVSTECDASVLHFRQNAMLMLLLLLLLLLLLDGNGNSSDENGVGLRPSGEVMTLSN